MPGEGHVGAFSFGDGFGVIKGVLAGLRIPSTSVEPQVWKKTLRVPADKKLSKARAIELFPDCSKKFTRPDLAEACMIALYGMMALGHPPIRKFSPLEI
jgi:crossover junction endodeoxyribonuclease RuvC